MPELSTRDELLNHLVHVVKSHTMENARKMLAFMEKNYPVRYGPGVDKPDWDEFARLFADYRFLAVDGKQGWLDRRGVLWNCRYEGHNAMANFLGCENHDLESAGWIHISIDPNHRDLGRGSLLLLRRTTEAQRRWLAERGVELEMSDEICRPQVQGYEEFNPTTPDFPDDPRLIMNLRQFEAQYLNSWEGAYV